MKALAAAMQREARLRENHLFQRMEIAELCARLRLDKEVDSLIETLRSEGYLLLKGPKLYQLRTAS